MADVVADVVANVVADEVGEDVIVAEAVAVEEALTVVETGTGGELELTTVQMPASSRFWSHAPESNSL